MLGRNAATANPPRRVPGRALTVLGLALSLFWIVGIETASAYIGPSFLRIPGIDGDWQGQSYRAWIRVEANYWTKTPPLPEIRRSSDLVFSGPTAPRAGANILNISVARNSPALEAMLELCTSGATIPEMTYAESSDRTRHTQEVGSRPADIPEYYEYRLTNIRMECPRAENAPEQPFVLKFENIEWLNYRYSETSRKASAEPVALSPAQSSGATRSFVVTWISAANDVSEDQCPTLNAKPGESEYYFLMSAAEQAETRAALAAKGGVTVDLMPFRGPDHLNVCLMPGIVADPGHAVPRSRVARGLNLDGRGGSKRHPDYVSPDGRTGIDNQIFAIEGCVVGFRRKGIIPAVLNQARRDGGLAILIQVSGIDDERNDDRVDVTLLYSDDPMGKNGTGDVILPDYTFRVSERLEYTQYIARLRGRIADGVITTEPVEKLVIHQGRSFGIPFWDARLRLEIMPDGNMKGTLGAYFDWRDYIESVTRRTSTWEIPIGYQCPAIYNAVRRSADGLPDPVTGQNRGISVGIDIEGTAAFAVSSDRRDLPVRAASAAQ